VEPPLVTLLTGDGRRVETTSSAAQKRCGFSAGTGPSIGISLEEADQCLALMRQKAAAAGLTCTPF